MGDIADDMWDEELEKEMWEKCPKHKCLYDPRYPCPLCEDEWEHNTTDN
jgi:hypothetical protein